MPPLFATIKGHKDADSLQVECLKKAEQARLAAERWAAEAKAAAVVKAKKTKKIAMIALAIVIVAIMAIGVRIVLNAKQEEAARLDAYNTAVALVEAGQYDEAITTFTELGDYKDSAELAAQVQAEVERQKQYDRAISQMDAGDFESAIKSFQILGDYKDSAALVEKANEELYTAALDYYRSGKPISLPIAWNNFNRYPPDYKDTQQFKDEIDGILEQLAGRYIKQGVPRRRMRILLSFYTTTVMDLILTITQCHLISTLTI